MNDAPIRVLVLEDDDADFRILSHSLAQAVATYEIQRVARIQDAVAEVERTTFDLILTDLTLPDGREMDAVRRIRAASPRCPMIVLTTVIDAELEAAAIAAGAQDYFIKHEAGPNVLHRALQHARQRMQHRLEVDQLVEQLCEQQSALKRKNKRLKKLYRMAQKFVDNVSHEFRTPLTVIKDYVTLLGDGLVGPISDEQKRMLDIVNVRTDDLNTMVDDMLDISKLEAGLLGARRRPHHASDVVRHVLYGLEKKAGVKNVKFLSEVDESAPEIFCDADMLGRVVVNLVGNAIKFCGAEGSIRLRAVPCDQRREVAFEVEDDGPGIPPEKQQEIFDRFKQTTTNIASSTKGFGLGLNIARELVDLNLGEISLRSTVGSGTTFFFTVPYAEPSVVVERYLARLRRAKRSADHVTMIVAETSLPDDPRGLDDIDAVLNFLQRRDDLMLRVGPGKWVLGLCTPSSELPQYEERLTETMADFGRNRPAGPLEPPRLRVVGSWQVAALQEPILPTVEAEWSGTEALLRRDSGRRTKQVPSSNASARTPHVSIETNPVG